jgi:hypothetical protein
LKLSKISRIVTAFSRNKKPEKEGLLKLSLTVFIVTAFNRHKTESQMVTIVTVTMRYILGILDELDKQTIMFCS